MFSDWLFLNPNVHASVTANDTTSSLGNFSCPVSGVSLGRGMNRAQRMNE